jgi:hypothetical protein
MPETLKDIYGDIAGYTFAALVGNAALAHRVLFWSFPDADEEYGGKSALCFCWGKYNALNETPQAWLEHARHCRAEGKVTWKTPAEIGEMTRADFVLFLTDIASR